MLVLDGYISMINDFVDYIQDIFLLEMFSAPYSMKLILGCWCYYSLAKIICYFLLIPGIIEDAEG